MFIQWSIHTASQDFVKHILYYLCIIWDIFTLGKEPKKRHLMMLLDPLRYQWEIIAKELKVRPDEINCERFNKAHYETRRLSEILQDWIDQTENRKEVCWKTILFVVESRIKNEHVADNIRGFLSIKYVQDEYLSSKFLIILTY